MIDCGEGTQLQLRKYKVNQNKITAIFISHLHGDHFLGLFALISTMSLLGRSTPLSIYGPKGLSEIITVQLKYSQTILSYPVSFYETDPNNPTIIYDHQNITVTTIPLEHRIDCTGFLFREKTKPRRINPDILSETTFSSSQLKALKHGEDILDETGNIIYKNEAVTLPPRKCRSYAFCSDTRYMESLVPQLKDVDLLYHEATFLNKHAERAAKTYHSTAEQAAELAKKSQVGKLLLGHFSTRYQDLSPFIDESKHLFDNVELAIEGSEFEVAH